MNKRTYLKQIDTVIEAGPYKPTWESLCQHPDPKWYHDAKFGIFIHWGVYCVPAFGSEWYPRFMHIKGSKEYEFHRKTFGPHDEFGYKDFIPMFKAEKFDPKAWAELFRKSGAKYVMPVAEHHDGFQMYASELSKWNAAEMGPKRDIVGELKEAVEAEGMTFSVSNHRAEHFWFMDGGLSIDSDVTDPKYADFYGPPHKGPSRNDSLTSAKPTKKHLEDWLLRNCELVDKYQPKVVWFDWWIQHKAFKDTIRKFAAYYYNRAAEWGVEVAINSKYDAYAFGASVFDIERGQLSGIYPRLWQNDTAIAKNSWGYTENNDFKTASSLIEDLIDIVSKNGCLLLNVGPKKDGTITDEETAVLLEIGEWLEKNGEGIYGTSHWKIFGEGPTKVPTGHFTDTKRTGYTSKDLRFTTKEGAVYVFVLNAPADGVVRVKSFAQKNTGKLYTPIKKTTVLGSDMDVAVKQLKRYTEFKLAEPIETDKPICLKVELV